MQLRSSILKAIAYFDIFNYPLSIEDILYFLDVESTEYPVRKELDALIEEGCLFRTGTFYSLRDDPTLADKRNDSRKRADALLPIAKKGARLLFQFPFVRGVFISGSLSKRCAEEKEDVDYLIVTSANRLWIARTLMHLFKKLTYLRGRQHRYCMNYYVDEEALEIREKNIFTATELITLMAASGNGGVIGFFKANEWTTRFYPQYHNKNRESTGTPRSSWLKRACERILNNRFGDRLDDYFQKITAGRWKRKEDRGDLNLRGHRMSLQCGKHFARPNPGIFQQKVLTCYQRKLKELSPYLFRNEMM
ncbi:MAG TPA: hypothetical protein VFE32_08000 [Puia sp.]|jgi:hypothetical protein|nr:hypothetical protein [Puia sp.]